MNIREMIHAAKNFNPTEEQKDRIRKSIEESERKFKEEEKRCAVTQEFLNKTYNL